MSNQLLAGFIKGTDVTKVLEREILKVQNLFKLQTKKNTQF